MLVVAFDIDPLLEISSSHADVMPLTNHRTLSGQILPTLDYYRVICTRFII